jgi:hypothetical protein
MVSHPFTGGTKRRFFGFAQDDRGTGLQTLILLTYAKPFIIRQELGATRFRKAGRGIDANRRNHAADGRVDL